MCVIKQVVYTYMYMLGGQDILYMYWLVYYVILWICIYENLFEMNQKIEWSKTQIKG
jgi:hypothetical protein